MNNIEKRYQVFVSSTFKDLQEERQEVIQALLELDCIPAGMELFPAANEDQWSLIKRVIDSSDYYIVIIGGRYGSLGPSGIGFTEMEYRYAVESKKPVIAFLHKHPEKLPADRTEPDTRSKPKLQKFRELCQTRLCKYWTNPSELGSQVSRSIIKLIKDNPSIGWVRGDTPTSSNYAEEALELRRTIQKLEEQLAESRENMRLRPDLAQGTDELTFEIEFDVFENDFELDFDSASRTDSSTITSTWDEVFKEAAPVLFDGATDAQILASLSHLVSERAFLKLSSSEQYAQLTLSNFRPSAASLSKIKIQLRALGLIERINPKGYTSKSTAVWVLTPLGDERMTTLIATHR